VDATASESDHQRFPYDSALLNRWALPAALGLTALAKLLIIPGLIFWYFFVIPIHELGHTAVAYAGGRFAIPIGAVIPMAGVTFSTLERSIPVVVVCAALLAWLGWQGLRRRQLLLVYAGLGLLPLMHYSFRVSDAAWREAMTYGGVGGEFVLSTFFVCAFYYRLPDRLRWDVVRFPFLLAGAFTFATAYWKWIEIAGGADLPWGSFLSGSGDSSGDMERLCGEFGWKPRALAASYLRLGRGCIALMLAHYLAGWKPRGVRVRSDAS
jgi:hypothetical protein